MNLNQIETENAVRRKLRDGATPPPWDTEVDDEPYEDISITANYRRICKLFIDDAPEPEYNTEQRRNARFIIAARNDNACETIDELVAEVRQLRTLLAARPER